MKKDKLFPIVFCALMTACAAVLSQIVVPTPLGIPITLQTFIFALCGYLLGLQYGFISVFLYIAMGVIGLPVFCGFRGGISALIGDPTGGFIIGFVPLTVLCGAKKYLFYAKHGKLISVIFGIFGVIICHLCGITMYSFLSHIGFFRSAVIVSLPFILKDIILCILAFLVSNKILKIMKNSI